jgi:small subunit ribosomal protein S9
MNEQRYYQGTGRRKSAVARVRLFPGSGEVVVNGKPSDVYFGPRGLLHRDIRYPLEVTNLLTNFDVSVKVCGGGVVGQAGATRLGIARALMDSDPDLRSTLKKAGLITRDARVKERKKPGLKRARKRPQYTKR